MFYKKVKYYSVILYAAQSNSLPPEYSLSDRQVFDCIKMFLWRLRI